MYGNQTDFERPPVTGQIEPDCLLIDFLRDHGCLSVKRGGATPPTAGCAPS